MPDHLQVPVEAGRAYGSVAKFLRPSVDICPGVCQDPHELQVPPLARHVQDSQGVHVSVQEV